MSTSETSWDDDSPEEILRAFEEGHKNETRRPNHRWPTADALRLYRGQWVLILDTIILCAHEDIHEIIACSRATGLQTTTIFQVPIDPRGR